MNDLNKLTQRIREIVDAAVQSAPELTPEEHDLLFQMAMGLIDDARVAADICDRTRGSVALRAAFGKVRSLLDEVEDIPPAKPEDVPPALWLALGIPAPGEPSAGPGE